MSVERRGKEALFVPICDGLDWMVASLVPAHRAKSAHKTIPGFIMIVCPPTVCSLFMLEASVDPSLHFQLPLLPTKT